MDQELLSIQEAAARLKVSTKTLRRWEARGVLIPQRTRGSHRRYTKSQVENFWAQLAEKKAKKVTPAGPESLWAGGPFNITEALAADSRLRAEVKPPTRRMLLVTLFTILSSVFLIVILSFTTQKFILNLASKKVNNSGILGSVNRESSGSPREAGGQVLAAATGGSKYSLNINVPSNFLKGVEIKGLVSALGGIETQGANVDAGAGSVLGANLIYGVASGSGILIGTGQTPTITNSGVLTLNNTIGDLTIKGSGATTISTSGKTITISSTSGLSSEADTLATVTGRGATTSTASTFSGGLTLGGTISLSDTNAVISLTNAGTLKFNDGTNTLATLTDNGTTATLALGNASLTNLSASSGNALCVDGSNNVVTCTVGSGGISGSGSISYIPKFTTTSAIGNSGITDDGSTIKLTDTATSVSGTLGVTGAATFSSTINFNTFTSTALTFAGASPAISASTAGTSLTIDANGAGTVSIAGTSTGDVNLAGGSGGNGCTITNSNGNLACSGTITANGTTLNSYWSRTSTTLSPATANDIVSIANTTTTGADLAITNTGIYTGTGLVNITANSATSGDILALSGTALTSGSLLTLTGPSGGTAGVTDAAIKLTSDVGNIGTSNGLISSTATIDSTDAAASAVNLYLSTTNSPATNANTAYGVYSSLTDATALADTLYGVYSSVSNASNTATGTHSIYGGYFTAAGKTAGTTTAVGLYATASGADNNYAAIFNAGNVGIRTNTPQKTLTVGTTSASYRVQIDGADPILGFGNGEYSSGTPQYDFNIVAHPSNSSAAANTFTFNMSAGTIATATNVLVMRGDRTIGINTTAPDAHLEINDATGDILRMTYNDSDGSATNYTDFSLDSSGGLTITGSAATLADGATAEKTFLTLTPGTITLTGPTQVTSVMDTSIITGATIAATNATIVNDASGLTLTAPIDSTNATLTRSQALRINDITSGAGTLTSQIGLYIAPQTGGATNNYGICFDCDGTWTSSTVASGIQFGTDANSVNLYRSANDTLKTDDNLAVATHLSAGADYTISTSNIVNIGETSTGTSGNIIGTQTDIFGNPGGASSGTYFGLYGQAITTSGNGQNFTGGLRGAFLSAKHQGTATVSTAYGASLYVQNTSTGTITDARAVNVRNAANTGGGTIDTNYGVYVENMTSGTNDYGIYVAGADTNAIWVDAGTVRLDSGLSVNTGSSPSYALDVGSGTSYARALNISQSGAKTVADYGAYIANTSTSSTASVNKYGAYLSSTGTWNGTSANNYGLYVDTSSGGTNNYGISVGAISEGNTSNYGLNINNISGATTSDYAINIGTLTGGTGSSGYQINAGNITAIASGTWGGINLGTITPTTSATTYGINIGNTLAGAGTATYGINIGTNASTATTNYGIKVGAISGAGTTNYGLYVDSVSGGTGANYAAIFAGGNVGIGTTGPTVALQIGDSSNGKRMGVKEIQSTNGNIDFYSGIWLGSSDISGTNFLIKGNTGSSYINGGNVGIGTTAPDKLLELNSATGANLRLTYNDNNGSAANYTDFSTGTTGDLTITGSAATLADGATAEKTFLTLTPGTITLTGPTQVTSVMDTSIITGATIAATNATTVDDAAGLTITAPVDSTNATLTRSEALRINDITSGAGTLTSQIGLYIAPQTGGSSNYGICFDCDGTWTSSTVAAGIQFGTDANAVNLYRSASDTLKTDDALTATGVLTAGTATSGFVLGSGANATTLSSTATQARAISFPDAAGTICISGQTCASSGTVGYWSRTSTTLSPATANDIVSIANTTTTGADLAITNTGIYTGTGLVNITANSATSGDILALSGTALTSGSLLTLTGPSGGTAGVTDAAIKLTSDVGNIGTSNGLISSTATFDGSAATGVNLFLSSSDAIAAANTDYGSYNTVSNTGALNAASTKTIYGSYISATGTGATTNASVGTNVYGQYITTTASHATNNGTVNQYGLYVASGTSSTNGTASKYGLYLEPMAGADTNVGLCFDCDGTWTSSTVASGIQWGTDASAANLYRSGDNTLTTDDSLNVGTTFGVGIATAASGVGVNVEKRSTNGSDAYGTLSTGSVSLSNVTNLWGVYGKTTINSDSLTITNAYALYAKHDNNSKASTTTNAYGLYVVNPAGYSGVGTLTTNYGIFIENETSGTTSDYGLVIGGADTFALWLSSGADNTDAANGIAFGLSKDTNLYRSAASTLKTDSAFTAGGLITAAAGISVSANQNLTLASGTGQYSQTFTGTTTDALTVTAASLTTGSAIVVTGPSSTGVTDHFVKLTSDIGSGAALIYGAPDFSGAGVSGYGLNITGTDVTTSGNTDYASYISLTSSGNAAKTLTGYYATLSSTSTTADTLVGVDVDITHSGNISTGTKSLYGVRSQPSSAHATDTGGTINTYGGYFDATGATGGTSAAYGVYIADISGADTNVGLCFDCDGTWTSSTVASGIQFGTDANSVTLYRSASDTLKTDDSLLVAGTLTVSTADSTLQFSATTATEKVCGTQSDGSASSGIIRDCSGTPGDYAEQYGTDGTLEAGDLVVPDPAKNSYEIIGKDGFKGSKAWIVKTNSQYQTGLFGVVSTQPNDVIGKNFEENEHPQPITLSGRVPVKVSGENGPIKIGDPITSSSTSGVGMRAKKAGRIIGIALESFNIDGIGKIMVFVNPIWHDPDVFLADNGSLVIINQGTEADPLFAVQKHEEDGTTSTVDRVGAFKEIVAGTIKTGALEVKDLISESASFSGTLTAGTIRADHIDGLDGQFESTASAALTASILDGKIASVSARIDNIEDLLRRVNFVNLATSSGEFASVENLMVSGSTTLSELSVLNTLSVGNDLTIGSNNINTINTPLEIQSLAQQDVSFLGGKITFDTEGNIKVVGNVYTEGNVTARSAKFAKDVSVGGVLSAKDIAVSRAETVQILSDSEIIATGSSALVTLKAGTTELTVNNEVAKTGSAIFITPTTELNLPIYIKNQADGSFTVGIKEGQLTDINFNFLIVN